MNMLEITVGDLKQFVYCPRVVYYHYIMPVKAKPTYSMEYGMRAEMEMDALEKRRTLSRYGLDKGVRKFNHWVRAKRLGLSGKLDLLIDSPDGLYPVDFKFTLGRDYKNHHCQICGYALILEELHGRRIENGFLFLIPRQTILKVPISDHLRADTIDMLDRIRQMVENELIPEATDNRAKCTDCEYRNYCGDVF